MIIDGKTLAANERKSIKERVTLFQNQHGFAPGLAVIIVGTDMASNLYVRNKVKATQEVGIKSFALNLPYDTTQTSLIAHIEKLNQDKSIHGILVQLPLPAHIKAWDVLQTINPIHDVDGLHLHNMGQLFANVGDPFVPCTPLGCLKLLEHAKTPISGAHAVIIGRSMLVGKPLAQLLLNKNATVTMAHSKTSNLKALCQTADILICAVGKPHLVRGDWVKKEATVIDVGINRLEKTNGQKKLVGDVAFDEVAPHARAITPVPGGVGPMTITMLLENTLKAAQKSIPTAEK